MITFQVTLDPEELQMLLDLENAGGLSCIEDVIIAGIITQIRKQNEGARGWPSPKHTQEPKADGQ